MQTLGIPLSPLRGESSVLRIIDLTVAAAADSLDVSSADSAARKSPRPGPKGSSAAGSSGKLREPVRVDRSLFEDV